MADEAIARPIRDQTSRCVHGVCECRLSTEVPRAARGQKVECVAIDVDSMIAICLFVRGCAAHTHLGQLEILELLASRATPATITLSTMQGQYTANLQMVCFGKVEAMLTDSCYRR